MNDNDDEALFEAYLLVKIIEFLIKVIKNIFKFIITTILTIILLIPRIIKKYNMKKKQKNFNFNEFDDVENIHVENDNSMEQLNDEWKVLNEIAFNMYKDKRNDVFDIAAEQRKAVKDMQNFEFLDSIKVDNDINGEGIHVKKLKEKIKGFDVNLFKNWSMQIFKCVKLGEEEKIKIIKEFITNQMYQKLIHQNKKFKKDGLEFITEDFIIKDVSIVDYVETMNKEEIKICIEARMKEYILDKNKNIVIRGNNKKSYDKKYIMTFLKRNIISKEGFVTNCPNCGGESTQVELGKCMYCDTLIFPVRYNWILTKFETV